MPQLLIRLKGLAPPVQGTIWEGSGLLRVGRLPNLDVPIADSSLSRLHAELVPTDQGWVVHDLGSTNGTFLNGDQLGRAEARLRAQDILQFGEIPVTVASITELTADPDQPTEPVAPHVTALNAWNDLSPVLLPAGAEASRELLGQLVPVGRCYDPADSLEVYLQKILWKAAEILDARQGALALLDEAPDTFKVRATFSLGGGRDWDDEELTATTLAAGRSLLSRPGGSRIEDGGSRIEKKPSSFDPRSSILDPRSSALCALLRVHDRKVGVLCLARWADQRPFEERDLHLADALALSVTPSIETVVRLHEQQRRLFLKTLSVLAQMVHFRDERTGSHAQRVTDYALMLAEEMRLSPALRQLLRVGASLHDLGKIGIPDAVLRKPGPLTPAEAERIREAMRKGALLVEQVPSLAELVPLVRSVLERWDGSGYPDGLAGEGIPLVARVVAVADAFDSMTTDQPYRQALPLDVALEEIRTGAGSQFDPTCATAFLGLRGRLAEILEQRRGATKTIGASELRKVRETLRQADDAQR
ncbi:MAG: FHA domain-containing protein [Gemmataceae bacterium]|nr:FHA domain-containing protein [Gemmataceae bacterium]